MTDRDPAAAATNVSPPAQATTGPEGPAPNAVAAVGIAVAPLLETRATPAGASLARPFGTAICLPGFMQADTVARHIPMLAGLPAATVAEVQQRFGAAAMLETVPNAGQPVFDRVSEPGVLALLEQVVPRVTPATPDNLIGYEWVEIAPMIAGRLLTETEPLAESIPDQLDTVGVARVCLFSYGKLPPVGVTQPPAAPQVTAPVHAEIAHINHQPLRIVENGAEQLVLIAQYVVRPLVEPVRVLVADGYTVALSGLSRLVALRRRGVERALCAVSYGYGHDAFITPPTIDPTLLSAKRPPLVADFTDERVAVTIPVRTQATVMTLTPQILRS